MEKWSVCYSCPVLSKIEIGSQGLLMIPNIKFHGNLSIATRFDPRGHTDRQIGAMKLTAAF
jgi:hypothetical protein